MIDFNLIEDDSEKIEIIRIVTKNATTIITVLSGGVKITLCFGVYRDSFFGLYF